MKYRFFDCRKSWISQGISRLNDKQKKSHPFCFGLVHGDADWRTCRTRNDEVRKWCRENDLDIIDHLEDNYVAFTNEDAATMFKLTWGGE